MLTLLAFALAASLEGDAAYDEGRRLYKGLEYEQAILQFEEVAVRPGLAPADKADVLMWLGLSYAGAGDLDAAKRNFRSALVADVTLALPPGTAPHVAAMFEDVRQQVQKQLAEEKANAPPPATPAPAPAPAPVEKPDNTLALVGGATAAGLGALALVGGGVMGALMLASLQTANDPDAFQVDAKNAVDAANAEAIGAGILLPVGAVLAGVGAVVLVMNLGE